MARLNNVKKLEERIAPSVLGLSAVYRCGNNYDGSVDGYPSGHLGPNASVQGSASAQASAPAAQAMTGSSFWIGPSGTHAVSSTNIAVNFHPSHG